MLLLLSGCWIGERGLAERLDADFDDVLLGIDCDDGNDRVQTMDDLPLAATVTCGETAPLLMGSGRCGEDLFVLFDDARPDTAPIAVMPCADPLDPDRYVPTQYYDRVVLVTVPEPTEVRISATTPECLATAPEPYALDLQYPTGTYLVANRGPACGVESCVVGSPLWTESHFGDVYGADLRLEASVSFFALPGERWFVVASSGAGSAQLEVSCPGIDPVDP